MRQLNFIIIVHLKTLIITRHTLVHLEDTGWDGDMASGCPYKIIIITIVGPEDVYVVTKYLF